MLRHHTRKTETDLHCSLPAGIATSQEVKTAASAKALLHRAGTLRPSLEAPTPEDVGYLLGSQSRHEGMGIGRGLDPADRPTSLRQRLHVVINAILDAPGAVVTTSTRPG